MVVVLRLNGHYLAHMIYVELPAALAFYHWLQVCESCYLLPHLQEHQALIDMLLEAYQQIVASRQRQIRWDFLWQSLFSWHDILVLARQILGCLSAVEVFFILNLLVLLVENRMIFGIFIILVIINHFLILLINDLFLSSLFLLFNLFFQLFNLSLKFKLLLFHLVVIWWSSWLNLFGIRSLNRFRWCIQMLDFIIWHHFRWWHLLLIIVMLRNLSWHFFLFLCFWCNVVFWFEVGLFIFIFRHWLVIKENFCILFINVW